MGYRPAVPRSKVYRSLGLRLEAGGPVDLSRKSTGSKLSVDRKFGSRLSKPIVFAKASLKPALERGFEDFAIAEFAESGKQFHQSITEEGNPDQGDKNAER